MEQPKILVIDLGSQYSSLIGRSLRELGYRSAVLSPAGAKKWLVDNKPKSIIMSGGKYSVYEEGSPRPPESIFDSGIPILGICYGMQLIADHFGGKVESPQEYRDYGETAIAFDTSRLFYDLAQEGVAWASHGDSVIELPDGFSQIATALEAGGVAAMEDVSRKIYGLQFHPEVKHTQKGERILERFVGEICGCVPDWNAEDQISALLSLIKKTIGRKKAVVAFSGGVDSTFTAALVAQVIGSRSQAVCIDTGALRKGELEEIQANAKAAGINLRVIDARDRFFEALAGLTDAEKKRKAFKPVYRSILDQAVKEFGAAFIIQGGIAPDHIESAKAGEAALIKSHHNTGLKFKAREFNPIREFFKYEVREMARRFGLPELVTERQPFPGPGLFPRIVGMAVTPELVEIVRWADDQVANILKKHGEYQKISQLVVVLIGVRTVGIKGDGRSYHFPIVVRAVDTIDFMTADGYQIPAHIRKEITRVVTKHSQIVRVVWDETSKPPSTVEWE